MAKAAASPLVALITGASRGIGLGLAEAYAKKGYRVIATARDPAKADKLNGLVKAHPQHLAVAQLDVADSKSVAALPAQLRALKPPVAAIDLLVNNAGIFSADFMVPIENETVQDFMAVYRTNVVGTWEVTQALLPFVRQSKAPKVVNVSSLMASIKAADTMPMAGLAVAYRSSKAALNMLSASQAREFNAATVAAAAGDAKAKAAAAPLITVVALHPGWVDTDLGNGGGKAQPPLTVAQSVAGCVKTIDAAKTSATLSFVDWEGNAMDY